MGELIKLPLISTKWFTVIVEGEFNIELFDTYCRIIKKYTGTEAIFEEGLQVPIREDDVNINIERFLLREKVSGITRFWCNTNKHWQVTLEAQGGDCDFFFTDMKESKEFQTKIFDWLCRV